MKSFLFKEKLLKKIVLGNKTQTRRTHGLEKINQNINIFDRKQIAIIHFLELLSFATVKISPKYKVGEICYLKENYNDNGNKIIYQADIPFPERKNYKWKSKLMMPETAARYFVEITDVKLERIKDITEEDAIAEGIEIIESKIFKKQAYRDYLAEEGDSPYFLSAKNSFFSLWNLINGPESIDKNYFVFVYKFKLVKKP